MLEAVGIRQTLPTENVPRPRPEVLIVGLPADSPKKRRPVNRMSPFLQLSVRLSVLLGAWCVCVLSGCHTMVRAPEAALRDQPRIDVGRELDMVALPRYVIEPPDILLIDALRIVPKDPFRIEPLDILYVNVAGTSLEQPIDGVYAVEPGGSLDLGPAYGKVKVAGLSLDEASTAVDRHLRRTLKNPQVSVTLSQSSGQQQIIGEHLVGPDGKINLGTYGTIYVTGMTIPEATEAIVKHLSQFLDDPVISVSVAAYNSKVFYVVTEGGGQGDNIVRFPIQGNERVLDALTQVNGRSRLSSKSIWIARPAPGQKCDQILPVNYDEIVRGADTSTNYQIMPGDRILLAEDHWVRTDGWVNKVLSPVQRVFEFTLLGTNTLQNLQRYPTGFSN